ncbi:hypothetical protein RJ639_033693 [Escallonia herrerae]|uniref:BHLH domain-containing protein n=1 Tax=Escallonia herrerae TaxID=1293975 RepID=A0AA88WUK7_9ASTE|nr:hypothetical protein RJ639_033693 [Escallonia herrerae]
MKNTILPSVSSQLYSFGGKETISEIPAHMDSKINPYGSSFCFDLDLYNNDDLQLQGGFEIPQSPCYCQPAGPPSPVTKKRLDYPCIEAGGYLTTTSSYDNFPQQPALSHAKKLSVAQFQTELPSTKNPRKRKVQVDGILRGKGSNDFESCKYDGTEWMVNKKAALCFEERCHDHQAKEEAREVQRQRVRVPVKRSQKLSDRITALQKLVSPYGKTDTASVLHEASISIKLLQHQIQVTPTPPQPTKEQSKPLLSTSTDKGNQRQTTGPTEQRALLGTNILYSEVE